MNYTTFQNIFKEISTFPPQAPNTLKKKKLDSKETEYHSEMYSKQNQQFGINLMPFSLVFANKKKNTQNLTLLPQWSLK